MRSGGSQVLLETFAFCTTTTFDIGVVGCAEVEQVYVSDHFYTQIMVEEKSLAKVYVTGKNSVVFVL